MAAQPIGVDQWGIPEPPRQVRVEDGPVVWLRVMPTAQTDRNLSVSEIRQHAMSLPPLATGTGQSYVRSHEGFGVYVPINDNSKDGDVRTPAVVFAFTTGEVWAVDTYFLGAWGSNGRNAIPMIEEKFRQRLRDYAAFLTKIGISPPFRWIAGMEGLLGRGIIVPPPPGQMAAWIGPRGKCQIDIVAHEGVYTPGESVGRALKPFFERLFDSCGLERPTRLDEVADYD